MRSMNFFFEVTSTSLVVLKISRKMDNPTIFPLSDSAEMFLGLSATSTFTLLSNWNEKAEEIIKESVKKVTEINPILTGKLIKDSDTNEFKVVSGQHSEFFQLIDGPSNEQIPKVSTYLSNQIHSF